MTWSMRTLSFALLAVLVGSTVTLLAQPQQPVPQPFPKPSEPSPGSDPSQNEITREARPSDSTPPSVQSETTPKTRSSENMPAASPNAPTEATLGLPIYPTAVFLTSYDAGRGQRYYLFGTNVPFDEMVVYYKIVLDEGGDLIFEAPATHMFEVGRFRKETMAFPPGVTIKDYTWNGSEGYLAVPPGAEPTYFSTVIQIVPPPRGYH